MGKDKSTAEIERPSTAIVSRLDPQALLDAAVKSNASIETLERLLALAKDVRAIQAKEAWLGAMAHFQETCPPIRRSRTAKISAKSGGGYSYSYAPLSEVLGKIQPIMGPLGLSVSFRVRHEKDAVIAICRVSHEMGHHEESGDVAIPINFGDGAGASAAQHVGIASTYAKRYALLAIIGLAPEEDTDAKAEPARPVVDMPRRASEKVATPAEPGSDDGPPPEAVSGRLISEAQRKRLWAIAYNAGKNLDLGKEDVTDKVKAICHRLGFDSTDDITSGRYESICEELAEWGAGA